MKEMLPSIRRFAFFLKSSFSSSVVSAGSFLSSASLNGVFPSLFGALTSAGGTALLSNKVRHGHAPGFARLRGEGGC